MSILETIPIWDDPYVFTRYTDAGAERVFSYGLLLPELDRLEEEPSRGRVASRWGELQLEALVAKLAPGAPGRRNTSVMTRLARFRRSLIDAADRHELVPNGWGDELRWFLDEVQRPDRFVWRWRVGGGARVRVRSSYCRDLMDRLAVEYDHLVTRQPRLARCKLCGRVFVPLRPSRPEMHCRANLWRPGSPPTLLERCVPLDDAERRRTERRLHQRYRRATNLHGDAHPKTKRAKREWRRWQYEHPPPRERGRQPRPEVTHEPEEE